MSWRYPIRRPWVAYRRRSCHNTVCTLLVKESWGGSKMCLEIWKIWAVNAAMHQGWCLHKQVALEQQCSFEANSMMTPLAAGWLSDRAAVVRMSSSPVREHYLGSSDAHRTCFKHPIHLCGGVFGPEKLTKSYMKDPPPGCTQCRFGGQ